MMNHLYEQLTALKLTGFRDALKKQLAQPGTYQELGFEERLSLLTAEELTCRENRKAERLIKHARFRLNAELSKLDYRNNRGLDRALIRSLSQGNWLTLKQNILLTGATGSGKRLNHRSEPVAGGKLVQNDRRLHTCGCHPRSTGSWQYQDRT